MTIFICVLIFLITSYSGVIIFSLDAPNSIGGEFSFGILVGLLSVVIYLGIIILKKISLISKNDDKGSDSKQDNSDQS